MRLFIAVDIPDDVRNNLSSFRISDDTATVKWVDEKNIHITMKFLGDVDENKVDLIITDQRMPEMSGVEFLKRVNEFLPGKPPCRMIYSGYSKTKDIDQAKENNWMSFFVSKPCDPDNLKAKIDTAIRDC